MLTALDQIANRNHLQLVKAVLPYVPPDHQKMLSVCVKMIELRNVMSFYGRGEHCVGACSADGGAPEMIDIPSDVRCYCEEGEQEMIDQCIRLMATIEMYSMFAQEDAPAEPETQMEMPERMENGYE